MLGRVAGKATFAGAASMFAVQAAVATGCVSGPPILSAPPRRVRNSQRSVEPRHCPSPSRPATPTMFTGIIPACSHGLREHEAVCDGKVPTRGRAGYDRSPSCARRPRRRCRAAWERPAARSEPDPLRSSTRPGGPPTHGARRARPTMPRTYTEAAGCASCSGGGSVGVEQAFGRQAVIVKDGAVPTRLHEHHHDAHSRRRRSPAWFTTGTAHS